jgi:hypothetical protein
VRKILCNVQDGQFSKNQILALEASLVRGCREHLGDSGPVLVIWCAVPRGQLFTEGKPSRCSSVMIEVDDGLTQARREAAMHALANEWARIAETSTHDLLLTLGDRSTFAAYLAANRDRVRPSRRWVFTLRTLAALVRSRLRDGYASIPANV